MCKLVMSRVKRVMSLVVSQYRGVQPHFFYCCSMLLQHAATCCCNMLQHVAEQCNTMSLYRDSTCENCCCTFVPLLRFHMVQICCCTFWVANCCRTFCVTNCCCTFLLQIVFTHLYQFCPSMGLVTRINKSCRIYKWITLRHHRWNVAVRCKLTALQTHCGSAL